MVERIRTVLMAVGLLGLFGLSSLALAPATYASSASTDAAKASACDGIGGTYDPATGDCTTQSASLDSIIANVINVISIIVGVAAVIMIMVGGFKYVTASGDSGKLSSAKSTIVYAVVGLVIVAFAQSIVRFVIKKTT
jgi:uncharacterized membrane protein YuzA (DUF378 family)